MQGPRTVWLLAILLNGRPPEPWHSSETGVPFSLGLLQPQEQGCYPIGDRACDLMQEEPNIVSSKDWPQEGFAVLRKWARHGVLRRAHSRLCGLCLTALTGSARDNADAAQDSPPLDVFLQRGFTTSPADNT
jgi:hypothetical protein